MIRSNVLSESRAQSRDESKEQKYIVYILRTSLNTLYIGQTNNLEKRIKEHKSKLSKSAKYIKYFDSCELVYSEVFPTRIEAMRREYQLKHWTKAKKEALIAGKTYLKNFSSLFCYSTEPGEALVVSVVEPC